VLGDVRAHAGEDFEAGDTREDDHELRDHSKHAPAGLHPAMLPDRAA
jgi:hypothetical protein